MIASPKWTRPGAGSAEARQVRMSPLPNRRWSVTETKAAKRCRSAREKKPSKQCQSARELTAAKVRQPEK